MTRMPHHRRLHDPDYDPTEQCTRAFRLSVLAVILALIALFPQAAETLKTIRPMVMEQHAEAHSVPEHP